MTVKPETAQQMLNIDERSDHDFEANANTGLIIYCVAWVVMVFASDFYHRQPLISLQLSIVLVVITLLRLCHTFLHHYVYAKMPKRWMLFHYILLLMHGGFWSCPKPN